MFQTPVLVIAYHRVESTHDLFTALRQIQPEKLYLAGGSSVMGYTPRFFSDKLKMPVDYLNPFKNFIPFLQKNFALSLKDEMWIWSQNVPKAMSASEKDHNEYDCKTTGDRITTFHSHLLAESETIFTEITSDYDIEYLD